MGQAAGSERRAGRSHQEAQMLTWQERSLELDAQFDIGGIARLLLRDGKEPIANVLASEPHQVRPATSAPTIGS